MTLIARIRRVGRFAPIAKDRSPQPPLADVDAVRTLEDRVRHLEQLVEGLQDSVHREALRHDKRIAELEARIQPAEMTKALSQDARERGL